jgi:hypothetical protein
MGIDLIAKVQRSSCGEGGSSEYHAVAMDDADARAISGKLVAPLVGQTFKYVPRLALHLRSLASRA